MVTQTQVNGSQKRRGAGMVFRENLSGLLHDVVELGELQTRLLMVDLNDASRGSVTAIVLVVSALVLSLGSVPVLLVGIGWALITFAGWTHTAAFAATGAGGLVLAAVLAWLAWRTLNAAVGKLSRSRDELAANVAWIKDALKHSSAPSRRSSMSSATSHDVSQERTSLR